MSSVTFPVTIGGDGSTVTDDTNASTGLGNGGHRTRFVPALEQMVAIAAFMVPVATNALNGASTSATSASSMTIGTGSKSLTLAQTGKAFAVGQWVQLTDLAAPGTNYMLGAITAFNAGTGAMTVTVALVGGSGTKTSWAVHPASPMSAFVKIDADGSLLLTGSGGLGYGTGSGGSVTQLTSKSTDVVLDKPCGRITMNAALLAADSFVSFTFYNSTLAATDILDVQLVAAQHNKYRVEAAVTGAGLAVVTLWNVSATSQTDGLSIAFSVRKVVYA